MDNLGRSKSKVFTALRISVTITEDMDLDNRHVYFLVSMFILGTYTISLSLLSKFLCVSLIGDFSEEPVRPFGEPPKMPLMLLWLFCLACQVQAVKKPKYNALASFAAQTDPKSLVMNAVYRVHEESNMALTPGKILTSCQRNIFQSVFIKLEKPKPPEKPCSFDCYPDNAKMELHLEQASTCWIGKQVFPSLTIIEIAHTDNKKECVIACLADRTCAVASHDPQKSCALEEIHSSSQRAQFPKQTRHHRLA